MRVATMFLVLFLGGCASSQVTRLPVYQVWGEQITHIVVKSSDALSTALGIELFGYGFRLVGGGEDPDDPTTGLLTVAWVAGYDGFPDTAAVQITDRHGKMVAGVHWRNGRGGVRGSPMDQMERKSIADAAREIAVELVDQLIPQDLELEDDRITPEMESAGVMMASVGYENFYRQKMACSRMTSCR